MKKPKPSTRRGKVLFDGIRYQPRGAAVGFTLSMRFNPSDTPVHVRITAIPKPRSKGK